MLSNTAVAPTLPVKDLGRARKFYEDKLGLTPIDSSSSGVLYKCGGGTNLFVYKAKTTISKHIVAVFEVDNLQREVKALQAKGVVFQGSTAIEAETLDDLTSLSHGNVACFEDSEGNLLAIAQIGMLFELQGEALPFRW